MRATWLSTLSGVLLGAVVLVSTSYAAKAPPAPPKPDVRVLVDISGSMKKTDPQNLRRPAIDLLIRMFPQDARAGVWTFGQGVNLLIPHARVDEAWRKKAAPKVPAINSVGLFTHIGAALEKASYDFADGKPRPGVSVILLTDGKVDISKDAAANDAERRRILEELLPRFRQAGVRIHTVALSDDADRKLLEALSVATGGVAEVAKTADDLSRIFVQTFDQAVPSERVPFEGQKFRVDSSIKEFTALIFRGKAEATQLAAPGGAQHDARNPGKGVRWHAGPDYDLITVQNPRAGDWKVLTSIGPASRVTVISDLKFAVTPLESNLYLGDSPEVAAAFRDGEKEIVDPAFLRLIEIGAAIGQEGQPPVVATLAAAGENIPPDGVFAAQLPVFAKPGDYQVTFSAQSKTFKREQSQRVTVRELFAMAEQQSEKGRMITVSALSDAVDLTKTQLAVKVRDPAGKVVIQAMQSLSPGNWFAPLDLKEAGSYQVAVEATGQFQGGRSFSISLPRIDVEVEAAAPPPEPEHEAAAPKPEPEHEAPAEVEHAPAAQEEGGWTLQRYLLVAGIIIAHIVAIGVGVFVYRRVRGGTRSAILESDAGDNADLNIPAATAAKVAVPAAAAVAASSDAGLDDLGFEDLEAEISAAGAAAPEAVAPSLPDNIDDDIIDIAPGDDDQLA